MTSRLKILALLIFLGSIACGALGSHLIFESAHFGTIPLGQCRRIADSHVGNPSEWKAMTSACRRFEHDVVGLHRSQSLTIEYLFGASLLLLIISGYTFSLSCARQD